jgi:hypothetical protein
MIAYSWLVVKIAGAIAEANGDAPLDFARQAG